MSSWLIGKAGLEALRKARPDLAAAFFNQNGSYVIGGVPRSWLTQQVLSYTSYASYAASVPARHWVLYDPESWAATPLIEQNHPAAFITAFALLAHARGQQVIVAPARDLMAVTTADYSTATDGEPVDQAFLSSRIPASCAVADVYHCQAQADQASPAAYSAFVTGAIAQLPAGFPVWAGLTTLRGDPAAAMVACYESVAASVSGFWLNTDPDSVDVAVQFLTAVGTP